MIRYKLVRWHTLYRGLTLKLPKKIKSRNQVYLDTVKLDLKHIWIMLRLRSKAILGPAQPG